MDEVGVEEVPSGVEQPSSEVGLDLPDAGTEGVLELEGVGPRPRRCGAVRAM